ncbi:MAG: ABC transporter ATP-binding protein [Candidatus Binataceae bacterium]
MNPQIEAWQLRKRYGERVALDGVSLEVRAGEVVGLLGPNGAGKTTTLSILSGVITPDSGEVTIAGIDLCSPSSLQARRKLGLVPQSIALYPTLTARENLLFFGRMQGLASVQAGERSRLLLEEVGLADRTNDVIGGFSGGMKRRLNLACGMMHEPCVLLLDEPTVGVDPQSRGRIFSIVEKARDHGEAILYSTHYMEEVEQLADRIVLIDGGTVVAEGTSEELIAHTGAEPRIELVTANLLPEGWAHDLAGTRELARESNGGLKVSLALTTIEQAPEVLRRAERDGGQVIEFHLHRPNLQDAFLALTGHALRDLP